MSLFSSSTTPGRELVCLRTEPSDLDGISRLIASLNGLPDHESLHCPRLSAASTRTLLRNSGDFPDGWHHWFYKLVEPGSGRIVAALGCQPDAQKRHGWLWGPWCGEDHSAAETCARLLDAFTRSRPRTMTGVEAFLNTRNRAMLDALKAAGFVPGIATHLYTAAAPGDPLAPPVNDALSPDRKGAFPLLRVAHEMAFLRLHAEAFPAAAQSAQELLDGRDETRVIFTAADGLRLLGYVCVSINRTPPEGFVDYLAVKPSARGRGVGRWLLTEAQRWIFEARCLPQISLCVTDWRADARRLYESTGFRLQATGVAARLRYLPS